MNRTYRASAVFTEEIELDTETQFRVGGLRIVKLRFGGNHVLLVGHTVLGDGSLHPKETLKILRGEAILELPERVLDIYRVFLDDRAHLEAVIEAELKEMNG